MYHRHTLYFFDAPAEPETTDWWWAAPNGSIDTLVVVAHTAQEPFTEAAAGTLEKLMAAIKLSQENAAVLQVGETGISLPELIRQYQPARLLLFGLQPKDVRLHINAALYKPMAWNGCTILWADSLPKLDQDPTRKRTLWAALQSLYLA